MNWACEDGIPYPLPNISVNYTCQFWEGTHETININNLPFGRSSLIKRLRTKFKASQPICPVNIKMTSTSLVDQIKVA